jgi:predicted nucleic acid-binding protein
MMVAEYYNECGYKNTLEHYDIPDTAFLTVSITLGHFLWCEKDKSFLQKRMKSDPEYFRGLSPMRTSADLRIIQQSVRS